MGSCGGNPVSRPGSRASVQGAQTHSGKLVVARLGSPVRLCASSKFRWPTYARISQHWQVIFYAVCNSVK